MIKNLFTFDTPEAKNRKRNLRRGSQYFDTACTKIKCLKQTHIQATGPLNTMTASEKAGCKVYFGGLSEATGITTEESFKLLLEKEDVTPYWYCHIDLYY